MKKFLFILFISLNLWGAERIVTLTPSINEIVFALDEGQNVVANTKFCDFPVASQKIKKIGGYATISLEKILQAHPTVVIGQDYDNQLNSNLSALGIQTKIYKTNTLDSIKNTIKDLGLFFHKEQKADELISGINNTLDSLKGIVNNQKILIVISPKKSLSNQIYVAGNYIYFEDIIQASGNQNAYFSTSHIQPVVNSEKIIHMNPDIIVLLAPFLEAQFKEQEAIIKAWESLPIRAAKNKNIYMVDKAYAGIPSQRVVYFMQDFKKILENVRNK
ncbi:MAG: ABC transporter substrate-binding protein [Candidatus Marinarcus sp.]|uniref:ABC transporter substrate-binding protein n=1 Tax=Candidatus Marinarcus sp. TaxID=3100987 RepID=UPI003B001416